MLLMFCYVKTYYAQYKGKQLVSSRELGSGLKQHPRQVISFNLSLRDCFLPAIQFWLIMKEKNPQPSIEVVSDLVIKTALQGKENINNKENQRSNKCG